ncbi:MAG: hypothetical protein MZV70_40460 [Desulfobacterales bacterium]|nr:hypothetical protein [Desulfobacterales bacterium]
MTFNALYGVFDVGYQQSRVWGTCAFCDDYDSDAGIHYRYMMGPWTFGLDWEKRADGSRPLHQRPLSCPAGEGSAHSGPAPNACDRHRQRPRRLPHLRDLPLGHGPGGPPLRVGHDDAASRQHRRPTRRAPCNGGNRSRRLHHAVPRNRPLRAVEVRSLRHRERAPLYLGQD